MNKKDFLKSGILEEYILGIADAKKISLAEEMINEHEDLAQLKGNIEQALSTYCKSQYSTALPPEIDQRVSDFIQKLPHKGEKKAVPLRNYQRLRWISIAACLGLGIMSLIAFTQSRQINGLENELMTMGLDLQNQKAELLVVSSSKANLLQECDYLKHEMTNRFDIKGTALAPQAYCIAFFNEQNNQLLIHEVSIPNIPDQKTLQFWADINGEMVNIGTIETLMNHMIPWPKLANASSINITLENAGGSEHPDTEQIYMVGQL